MVLLLKIVKNENRFFSENETSISENFGITQEIFKKKIEGMDIFIIHFYWPKVLIIKGFRFFFVFRI